MTHPIPTIDTQSASDKYALNQLQTITEQLENTLTQIKGLSESTITHPHGISFFGDTNRDTKLNLLANIHLQIKEAHQNVQAIKRALEEDTLYILSARRLPKTP